jgi:hypothetical protein
MSDTGPTPPEPGDTGGPIVWWGTGPQEDRIKMEDGPGIDLFLPPWTTIGTGTWGGIGGPPPAGTGLNGAEGGGGGGPTVNDRGTFTLWTDAAVEIEANGVTADDQFTIEQDPNSGTWIYVGATVAPGTSGWEFDGLDWQEAATPSASAARAKEPRRRKR